jgi:predicted nucleic acid-binding protein
LYGSCLYLDSSALVKLILPEAETLPLLRLMLAWPHRVASNVAFIEVHRAIRRAVAEEPTIMRRSEEVLATIHFMDLHVGIIGEAALIEPWTVRSLDAIHLATARNLAVELGGLVTYDRGMAEAARRLKLKVLSPA